METINPAERVAYYQAALRCLQFVEQRKPTGRRFGTEADARWASFRGGLSASDRIDLLLRDADTEWPGALEAWTVFGLRAVAEDEAFGAEWQPLDPVDAEELWRGLEDAPTGVGDALAACAKPWGVALDVLPGTESAGLLAAPPGTEHPSRRPPRTPPRIGRVRDVEPRDCAEGRRGLRAWARVEVPALLERAVGAGAVGGGVGGRGGAVATIEANRSDAR